MFDHSIKVPRLYKFAAKVAKDVQENKGSLKQLVYQVRHNNIKGIYALAIEMFKRRNELDNLLKRSKLLVKEPKLDPVLARILITELLWGKKRLPGESKPVKTVLAYEQILKAHLTDISENTSIENVQQVQKPRYVRVNTIATSVEEAINAFIGEEWNLVNFNDKQDYKGFLETVNSLGEYDFMVDIHIPELLIFHPKTQFYDHFAYKEGNIILQDKASCLPSFILNPEKGSEVLDMCAAPGMKTTHLAAIMNNEGKIYASEIDQKRIGVLENILGTAGVTCVTTINKDVLTLTDEECPDVEYILVDPSCSGSGIVDRLELDELVPKDQQHRLTKLAGFQIKILRHALTKFRHAKRVVYSTCSINPEENEDVVRQVLETCTTFKLVPAKKFLNNIWLNYGSPDFGNLGKYCLYTRPEVDLTNGFFIAVFERLEEGDENEFLNKNVYMKHRKTKEMNDLEKSGKSSDVQNEPQKSSLHKRKYEEVIDEENGSNELKTDNKKKKKKRKESVYIENETKMEVDILQSESKKENLNIQKQSDPNIDSDRHDSKNAEAEIFEGSSKTDIHEKSIKKQKNRKKCVVNDDEQHNVEEISYNNESTSHSEATEFSTRKKKKESKKKCVDNEDDKHYNAGEINYNNEDILQSGTTESDVKKKKKNKKKESLDHMEYNSELTNKTNETRLDKIRHKKKNKKQNQNGMDEISGSTHTCGPTGEIQTEDTGLNINRKSKKKKKRKHSVCDIDEETPLENEHVTTCDEVPDLSQLKKKKKKKKDLDST